MKQLQILLLVYLFSVISLARKEKKMHKSQENSEQIDQDGIILGEQILHEIDYQRELVNIKEDIPRTDRMQQIAFDYAELLLQDPSKLKTHPEFYSRAKKFTDKSVYSEYAAILIAKKDFAHEIVKLWKKEDESFTNMKKEYDECGAYCANYGNGYLCTAVFLNLAQNQEQIEQKI